VAEAVGTAFLLAAVVGSGIMGERLAGGNVAVTLLANTLATGAALVALILAFGPISGAHLNPAVTLADAALGGLAWSEVPLYIGAQVAGALGGVATAHVMFELPLFFASAQARAGSAQVFSEFVATFGLLAVIWGCARSRSTAVPFAVAGYITAAYWFTASTSFANPAVTLARSASDTFAGIRPSDTPAFIAAQLVGAAAATGLFRWLVPARPTSPAAVAAGALTTDSLRTRLATPADAEAIAAIYNEGIADRIATFETEPRTAAQIVTLLTEKGDRFPTVVVEGDGHVVAWASAGPYRSRPAYAGVAEHSVYVARAARGTGAGRAALEALCRAYSERAFWKIVSRIFPENTASLALHERCGFRVVGVYRRHGKLGGQWRDCVIVERLLT
jgi:L-amino acid N-acyltransferase YncA/glycerol uptake facilitator-like aquaporin